MSNFTSKMRREASPRISPQVGEIWWRNSGHGAGWPALILEDRKAGLQYVGLGYPMLGCTGVASADELEPFKGTITLQVE